MSDPLNEPIRSAVAVFLDAVPTAPRRLESPSSVLSGAVQPRQSRPRRRVLAVASAAAVIAFAAIGVAILSQSSAPQGSSSISPAADPAGEPTSVFDDAAVTQQVVNGSTVYGANASPPASADTSLDWHVAVPSPMSTSHVTSVVAGPVGFVAIGNRIDGGANHNFAWFSSDGSSWREVSSELFSSDLFGLTATSSGYFVLSSSTDPSGTTQLLTSSDGLTWRGVGVAPFRSLNAAGDVLVAVETEPTTDAPIGGASRQALLTSTDGILWTPTMLTGLPQPANVVFRDDITTAAGRYFMTSVTTDAGGPSTFEVWTSSDGIAWDPVPSPPAPGELVSTPDRLLVSSNTASIACAGQADASPGTTVGGHASESSCTGTAALAVLSVDNEVWRETSPAGIPPTWDLRALSDPVGHLLLPITSSDGELQIYESSDAGATFHRVPDVNVPLRSDVGEPGAPASASILSAVAHGVVVLIGGTGVPGRVGSTVVVGTVG